MSTRLPVVPRGPLPVRPRDFQSYLEVRYQCAAGRQAYAHCPPRRYATTYTSPGGVKQRRSLSVRPPVCPTPLLKTVH